jgi:hypothetical protein
MSGIIGGAGSKSGVIGLQGIKNPIATYTNVSLNDASTPETSGVTYTCPLNTENDPYNLATLSSNVVTLSLAGRYYIECNAGVFGFYSETGSAAWGYLKLVTSSPSETTNGHDINGKDYLDLSNIWHTSSAIVKHTNLYNVGNTFTMQIVMQIDGWRPLFWQGGGSTGVSQMSSLTLYYLGKN